MDDIMSSENVHGENLSKWQSFATVTTRLWVIAQPDLIGDNCNIGDNNDIGNIGDIVDRSEQKLKT